MSLIAADPTSLLTERERRVLFVFDGDAWIRQRDVLRLARMDTQTCGLTLRRLRATGYIEADLLVRPGRGQPAHVYRLTARGRVARGL